VEGAFRGRFVALVAILSASHFCLDGAGSARPEAFLGSAPLGCFKSLIMKKTMLVKVEVVS
jgi:hypothetical protein